MKKLKNRSGFSLVEMLAAIGILVILVVGMDAGISAGLRAYSDSVYESNVAAMTDILNTAVSDVLRHAEEVIVNPALENASYPSFQDYEGNKLDKNEVQFVFTNYEYGLRDAYFHTGHDAERNKDFIEIKQLHINHKKITPRSLVNLGAYPDLQVADFEVSLDKANGCFKVHYLIEDMLKPERARREITTYVRLLNPLDN